MTNSENLIQSFCVFFHYQSKNKSKERIAQKQLEEKLRRKILEY